MFFNQKEKLLFRSPLTVLFSFDLTCLTIIIYSLLYLKILYILIHSTENGQKEKLKLLNKRQSLPPVEIAVYKNEELEKALRNGTLEKYKVNFQYLNSILSST